MKDYELVHKIYKENIKDINQRISRSKFPVTLNVMENFSKKIDDLLSCLQSMERDNNFYSSQCITRVINEHFLIVYFIWTKWRLEETDDNALDYVQYYSMFELMKRVNFNSKLDKSYIKSKSPLENFLIKCPEFVKETDPLTEQDIINVNQRSNKFDIRRIFEYLEDNLDRSDSFQPINAVIMSVCKHYNEISSYIHGGRLAELETFEKPGIDKSKILSDNTKYGKIFSKFVLIWIMSILLIEDKSFFKVYQPIHDLTEDE